MSPSQTGLLALVESLQLFPANSSLSATEIGDGNVNFVFRIADAAGTASYVVKQAIPYFKCAGPSYPLTIDRARIEACALQVQHKLAPGLVPEVVYHSAELGLIIMEDLSHLQTVRAGMLSLRRLPLFADHVSTFLSRLTFFTSKHYLSANEMQGLERNFYNPELCKITEDLIFTDPYFDCPRNVVNPALRSFLERELWPCVDLRTAVAQLKTKFCQNRESLIHGDLHTGSIFANDDRTVVFDAEFSFVGPSAFDLGKLIGNLLINYFCWDARDVSKRDVDEYRTHVLDIIMTVHRGTQSKLKDLLVREAQEERYQASDYYEDYLHRLFVDQIGYCATTMIRRMHGLARNSDVDDIVDPDRRAAVQRRIITFAMALLLNPMRFADISDLVAFASEHGG